MKTFTEQIQTITILRRVALLQFLDHLIEAGGEVPPSYMFSAEGVLRVTITADRPQIFEALAYCLVKYETDEDRLDEREYLVDVVRNLITAYHAAK